MSEVISLSENIDFLKEKTKFLARPETYPDATSVQVIETHMSLVFLTNQYVYKLKKPIKVDFLDFSTCEARRQNCLEEVNVNQALAGGIYLGVVPLTTFEGQLGLSGQGETVDWLVKMKRLPSERMLHEAINRGNVRNEWVQHAAEKLVEFYLASKPVYIDHALFRSKVIKDIEWNSAELLSHKFGLNNSLIVEISTDLLHFVIKEEELFAQRIMDGKVIDAHGDLRPEHICLGSQPVIIDRLEFNRELRVMDIAEELAFLSLECEMVSCPGIGQLFLNVYKWKSMDKIPDILIYFYRAKRALLRAKLSISHLMEERYIPDSKKWTGKCDAYLNAADIYCNKLQSISSNQKKL